MPFKIISTLENNKIQLSICPSQWENYGILRWPRKVNYRLIKDENAIPKPDWREINCILKRTGFCSYEEADNELKLMLNNTDTEHDDEELIPTKPHQTQKRKRPEPINMNQIADQLKLEQAASRCGNSSDSICAQTETGEEIIIPVYNQTTQMEPENTTNTSLNLILQNQAVLFETINGIVENQKKILHEIASLSVQMEEAFSQTYVKSLKDASGTPENESLILQQIKNVADLEKMELLLSDYHQKQKMIRASSIICSGGYGSGKNCAFRFVDVLFSRDFLCECSWSGSTRSDGIKVSLKCFKKTLNFFYDMIKSWDSSYTIEDNEKFFKDILRNSNKRKNVKYERISTKRRRTTKDNKSQTTQPSTLKAVVISGSTAPDSVAMPASQLTPDE